MTLLGPLPLSSHAKPVDSFPLALELEKELKRGVRGEVRFDRGSRALYATDGSNYRQVPIGLVVPLDESDVIGTVAEVCSADSGARRGHELGRAVLQRGGGARFYEVHESHSGD